MLRLGIGNHKWLWRSLRAGNSHSDGMADDWKCTDKTPKVKLVSSSRKLHHGERADLPAHRKGPTSVEFR
jgi:hypothetical protein